MANECYNRVTEKTQVGQTHGGYAYLLHDGSHVYKGTDFRSWLL